MSDRFGHRLNILSQEQRSLPECFPSLGSPWKKDAKAPIPVCPSPLPVLSLWCCLSLPLPVELLV